MIDGEDFIYRPVTEGILDPRALEDGSIGLYGIMLLNEALDVKAENQHRARKAAEASRPLPGRR